MSETVRAALEESRGPSVLPMPISTTPDEQKSRWAVRWRDQFRRDPRVYQILSLSVLLAHGMLNLGFDVTVPAAAAILGTALFTQYLCGKLSGGPPFDPKSAAISALSLCLLLRTGSLALASLAAVIAVSSKFLIRFRNKHIFNPTNLAVVVALVATDAAWISPAQWGSTTYLAFLFACLGMFVVHRAVRGDVTFAFLATYLILIFGRALWLGDPIAIPIHKLQSGALLLFAFFMISDPKTTPDSRAGRILFGIVVATAGWWIQAKMFRVEGLMYSLAFFSLFVPLLDWLLPGKRYDWSSPTGRPPTPPVDKSNPSRPPLQTQELAMRMKFIFVFCSLLVTSDLAAFCGFYVAKADAKLFNKSSQVAIARKENRTVLTMANDFQGDPKEFALVVPVPTFIQRSQINVADKALLDHLDAYSSPRLVEYFDPDPCEMASMEERFPMSAAAPSATPRRAEKLGVTIEARYTVGEYDILILSAKESSGLQVWLNDNGYRLPRGAAPILGSYIKQNMRFFIAKVNLKERAKLGFSYLRPLQIAFESPKFMLPIRLGTLNANGDQELFIYTLTSKGRVETTNYPTVKLPTGDAIPVHVKNDFGNFYKAMFSEQVRRENMRAVFLEYAWDMGWCDPCAADPLSPEELRKLGVFWTQQNGTERSRSIAPGGAQNVFITRLHVRYDADHFPEDLSFQETPDRQNFQARYVLRHAFEGESTCDQASEYRKMVRARQETEATNLARLTGWSVGQIRSKIKFSNPKEPVSAPKDNRDKPWWEGLWNR